MTEFNISEFEKNLRASGAMASDQIDQEFDSNFADARYAAKRLVAKGLLTEWQAKFLLSGRSQLKIGNYTLLERLEKSPLGERYIVWHGSLQRKGVMQFLPSEFNSQSENFESFISSARMLTEVDHPNLAHVYDVSAESDRYYVVQEHGEGRPIGEMDLAQLSPVAAMTAIKEMASAVKFLHDTKVEHGTISERNIWISADGQIQILELLGNLLRKKVLGIIDPVAAEQSQEFGLIDRVGIQGVCGDIMDRVFGRDGDTEVLGAIVQLTRSTQGLDRLIEVSSRWLAQQDAANHSPREHEAAEKREPKKVTGTEIRQRPKPPQPYQPKPAPTRTPPNAKANASPSRQTRLVYGGLAVLILAAGGLAFAAYSGAFNPGKNNDDLIAMIEDQAEERRSRTRDDNHDKSQFTQSPASAAGDESPEGDDKQAKNNNAENAGTEGPPTDQGSQRDQDSVKAADLVSGEGATSEIRRDADDPKTTDRRDEKNETGSDAIKTPLPADVTRGNVSADPNDPFVIPGMATVAANSATTPAVVPNLGEGAASAASTQPSGQFDLPSAFRLQNTLSTEPQTIGSVGSVSGGELKLALVYNPEAIGKGKNYFVLRQRRNENTWDLLYGKRENEEEMDRVGEFGVVEQKLQFRWLENLTDKSNANYIVNSILKVTKGNELCQVALREPLIFEEIFLDEKSFSKKGSLSLEWLPAAENIRLDPGVFDVERWGEAIWQNIEMEGKQPASIRFSMLESEQFFWIALMVEVKTRVEYKLDVQTIVGGNVISLKPNQLTEGLNALSQQYATLVVTNDQAQAAAENAPYGQKTKTRDYARDVRLKMEEMQKNREKANQQAGTIEGLVNVPIPFRVVLEFDGELIELARSSTFSDQSKQEAEGN